MTFSTPSLSTRSSWLFQQICGQHHKFVAAAGKVGQENDWQLGFGKPAQKSWTNSQLRKVGQILSSRPGNTKVMSRSDILGIALGSKTFMLRGITAAPEKVLLDSWKIFPWWAIGWTILDPRNPGRWSRPTFYCSNPRGAAPLAHIGMKIWRRSSGKSKLS